MEEAEGQEEQMDLMLDSLLLEDDLESLENDIFSPSPVIHKAQHLSLHLQEDEDDTTISSLQTPTRPLLDKFHSLHDSWSTVKSRNSSTSTQWQHQHQQHSSNLPLVPQNDEEDDDLSLGASTISTISSQESVFDRLFRQGTNHQRERRQSSSKTKRRLSYSSPKGSRHQPQQQHQTRNTSVTKSKSRTLAQRKTTPKSQTITTAKTRNRVSATKTPVSATARISTTTPSSENSVFHRLYRNEKRSESLWKPPPTPRTTPRSGSHTKRTKTSSTASSQPNKTLISSSTQKQSAAPKVTKGTAKAVTSASSTTSEKENTVTSPPTVTTRTATTVAATATTTTSTTSLDEDIHELQLLQYELEQQLAPTPQRTNVPLSTPRSSSSSINPPVEPKRLQWSSSLADKQQKERQSSTSSSTGSVDLPKATLPSPPSSAASTTTFPHLDDDNGDDTTTTSSKASSGFFTLDYSQSLLLPVGASLRESFLSKRQSKKASTRIQALWRGFQAQLRLARLLLEQWHVDYDHHGDASSYYYKTKQQRLEVLEETTRRRMKGVMIQRSNSNVIIEARTSLLHVQAHLSWSCYPMLCTKLKDGLLVRAVLSKAISELQGDLYLESSRTIQTWWRRMSGRIEPIIEEEKDTTPIQEDPVSSSALLATPRLLTELDNLGDTDDELLVSPLSVEQPSSKADQEEKEEWQLQSPPPTVPFQTDPLDEAPDFDYPPEPVETPTKAQQKESQERHKAATVIQNCFRMSTLTSAIEKSTHPQTQFRQALSSPSFLRWNNDSWLAKEPSDAFQRWTSTDLIERRASSLAIHNIVRAYLQGLRKYRRGKKATLIQATFRRYVCVRRYQMQLWAAMTIQFAWTNYTYRMTLRRNAIRIQGMYKMTVVQNKFQIIKFAAIVVQSQWRRWRAMQRYSKTRFLALWLQRTCSRGHCHRRRYLARRSSVISVQRLFRVRRTRNLYKLQTLQATRIQAAWKMSVALRQRLLVLYYAGKIQAMVRTHFARKNYQHKRQKIRMIQRVWKRHRSWKLYCLQQRSATRIQTQWRRVVSLRSWNRQRHAVVLLQCVYRMHYVIQCNRRALLAAVTVQTEWRRYQARGVYSTKQGSIIKLQTQWRRRTAQQAWRKTRIAIIALQSLSRTYIHRKSFQRLQRSAIEIQTSWRSFHHKAAFQLELQSILRVQSVVRQWIATHNWTRSRRAAVECQQLVRGYLARTAYGKARNACLQIQSAYRRHRAIENWKFHVNAVSRIQSGWRMALARMHSRHSISTVTTLQRVVRGYQQRSNYIALRMAATQIQARIRCWIQQLVYARIKRAATVVQAAMRGKVARNQLFKSLSSAVVLQRAMRRFSCRSKFVSFRMASCRIQASVRGHRQRSKYLRLNRNLLVLQRYGRGIVARQLLGEKSAAALVLQRCWRGTQGQLLAVKRLYSILMIQKVWRGFQEQTNLAQQLSNQLVLIQSVWRASIWRGRYRTYRSSASMIQSSMRRYLVRKTLQHNVRGVLSIQRIWRGYRKRVYLDVKAREETRVSILLQAKWRMYSAYKIHNASRGVAIILQARWRGRIARNAHREARSSAILIQSYWRTVQARESYSNARTSATMIQSLARGVAARNAISGLHLLSVNIQRNWRGHRDRRKCRLLLQNKQEVEDLASTRIQAYWRMRHSSLELKISLAAATSIQKHWRSSLDREQYSIVRSSCAMIQCHIRGALARTNIALWHLSAVQIQKHWRGYRGVQDFTAMDIANKSVLQEQHLAADRIQSVWRVAQARRTFKLTLVAAVLIQKHWRSSLARERYLLARASALMIQSIVRGVSFRTYLRRMHSSATSVQRVWRGRCQLQEYQLLIQKQAARRIQRNWRMTRSRHSLKISLLSAVLMQKHWRSSLARERYLLARASALMIQSIVRGVSFRRYLRRMHSSATEVQRVWRGRCQLKEYNKVKLGLANDSTSLSDDSKKAHSRDATCINILDNVNMENRGVEFAVGIEQTSKDQNGLQRTLNQNAPSALQVLQDLLNCSATQIQRTYRGSAARGILRSHRDLQNCSATQIQALWRGSVARSSIRFDRGIWMSSAIFIQSRVRGCITRDLVKQQTKAALSIQRVWRGRSLQLAFLQRTMEETLTLELEESSKYHAAVTLQAFVRCRAAGARFKFLRNACIVIQSFIRRQQNIKRFQAAMTAITLIQKHWKGSVDRRAFEKLRMCAIVIQSFFRMTRVLQDWWFLRFPEEKRNILEDAARKIQVAFFLWKMKLAVWQMQSSAIILQRSIRGQLVRSAARFALVHMNASFRNSVILSFARVVAGNDQEYAPTAIAWGDAVLKAKLSACTVIQSAARRMLAKRKVASDFGVEFGAELCMDQSRIEEEGSSAIVIQRAFRCKLSAKAGYTKQVVTLQTIYRGWKARKCYATILESRSRARHRETTHAAIQIQRTVRKMLSRVEGAKRRLLHTEKARSASTCLLERIEKSSKAVVDKLLYASEGNADVGPCIRRLAGRVRAACDEAAFHSANALPDYAKQFQCSGTVEPIKGDVVVTKSMSSLHVTTDVSTALPAQSIAEKGVSTPVRCNTTPSQDKTRTCPISQESDKVERQDNTRGLAIQARELLLIGRSATGMVHGTKHVLSVPSSSLKDHKKDDQAYQDTPQRSGERKDGSKSDNSLLFCDSKNMPSPIKKEADWDWADEW